MTNSGAHGGARVTRHVAYGSAINALHGVRFAREAGIPPTHMLTLDLCWVAPPHEPGRVLLALRQRVARWWRYETQKGRALGPWVLVVARASPGGHEHAHCLVRLPPGLTEMEFLGVVVDRLAKIAEVSRAVANDACHITAAPAPGTACKYVLKGIDPRYAAHLHIVHQDEGVIVGRRTSVSRPISRAARREAGWVRRRRPQGSGS